MYEINKKSRFLITGGAGFIGSNITEKLLNEGYSVRILDNFATGRRENIADFCEYPTFELLEGDIRDPAVCVKAMDGIRYVLHQAALGSVPRSIKNPIDTMSTNVMGTLNLMCAARDAGVDAFVYASSSSVYGTDEHLPKKEGVEGKVLSPYALSKYTVEELGRLFHDLYGLKTVILRYFNVFGRRQNPFSPYAAVIPIFIKELKNGKAPVIFGDGRQSRDFTYVENVIQANLCACSAPERAFGQVYNIGCGGRIYLLDVYYEICRLLNVNIEPDFAPPRAGDMLHSNADITKAEEILGYRPKWSFSDGLKDTIEWYKANL